MAAAKSPDHLFTEQELFVVMRLFLPDDEARATAGEIMQGVNKHGQTVERSAESAVASVIDFSLDTLILLSLLSEETRLKVERWRRRFGEPTAEAQRRWEARRAILVQWAEEGYP